jgi:acyl-coenzyme A synthetase/AMP-(fatty) acid ligase
MIPRDFLSRCARNFPEKAAYHCGERYVTWSQIHARSWRLAGGLQRVGLSKGDVVAVLGQESIEIYEHLFACMNVGFGRVGINWRYAAAEMLHVIEDSGAKALLVDARCEQQFAAIRDRTKCVGITTIGYGGAIACDYEYEDLFGGELKVVTPELSDEEPLLITYTSGSTGKPKGVIHSQRSVASIITQSVIGRGLSPDDIWYTAAASSWMTVLLNIQGILNGMTHVIVDGAFEIRRFLC